MKRIVLFPSGSMARIGLIVEDDTAQLIHEAYVRGDNLVQTIDCNPDPEKYLRRVLFRPAQIASLIIEDGVLDTDAAEFAARERAVYEAQHRAYIERKEEMLGLNQPKD